MTNKGSSSVLSAQEQAILDGKKVLHGTVTDRVLRMFEAIRSYGPPRLTLDRAVYFTESFKATEGQPLVVILTGRKPLFFENKTSRGCR